MRPWRVLVVACFALLSWQPAPAQINFGFDNRKPSGQEYLTPAESLKRLQVPPGWEVKLVAAEPDVINPIAFTIDERGRIWVVECFEYPKRTPKGKKPRDRIKIIEEDPNGGRPKVTVFAEGKDLPIGWDLASGIEVGHGGVFLGAPPYLFFLQDTDGDGKCDKQEILLKGFGSHDTHETLNTFQWGPDSKLYGLHGVFTHSEVEGVKLNAAVWRYQPTPLALTGKAAGKFEIFAEGTSNPWGMDFDSRGNCFLACCVIPHLFHMVPGGTYKRQAGGSFNPYAYGLLNEICDHEHHKQSGWAHAGLLFLDGAHVPENYRGSLIMGSIHGTCIKRDVLRPNASTFTASCAPDFLKSGDKNFRPINLRWGPDGSIYVIDWHDQNPCHQAAPDAWDYERGRIYKIQRQGAKPLDPGDLAKLPSDRLVELLTKDNPWWYRTALRLLHERRDPEVVPQLKNEFLKSANQLFVLRGLWALYAVGGFNETIAAETLGHKSPDVRAWTIRLLGESGNVSDAILKRFTDMAAQDAAPQVRLQLASTAQRLRKQDTLPLLHNLMNRWQDATDPCLPLMIWLAYEPRVVPAPPQKEKEKGNASLDWLKRNAPGNPLVTNDIVPRTMRRLASTGKAEDLDACVAFLADVNDGAVRRQALEGLVQAFKNRQVDAPAAWKRVFAELQEDADVRIQELARRLAVSFQDPEAIARALTRAQDAALAVPARLDALRDLALAHPPKALPILRRLLAEDKSAEVRAEVCRTLAAYDDAEIAGAVLGGWKSYPPLVRGEAVNLLAGRKPWAKDLLTAVGKGAVPRTDLTDNTILRIHAFKDKALNAQIEKVWGRFRDTPKELSALIDKMRGQLHEGSGSFGRGKLVFENQCAKCHKFEGKGHDVGPNLDGAARDIEYLLVNILDPNRVVGQPYYMRTVELKSGRIETGLLVSEDDQSITLKTENDAVKVIQRTDIEGKVLVQEKSIMPEGLANNMTVQDFRDLIRYLMVHPFLTEVAVTGPITGREEFFPFDPADPPASKDVKWLKPRVGPPGRIPLPPTKEPGWSYVVCEVTAPDAMRSRLQIAGGQSVQVLVNGKSIHTGKTGAEQAAVDIELRAGRNWLVFQVSHQGAGQAFYARLLDPDRRLRYPEP